MINLTPSNCCSKKTKISYSYKNVYRSVIYMDQVSHRIAVPESDEYLLGVKAIIRFR
jgi:hypothetical protein